MRPLLLMKSSEVILVDDEDWERLAKFKWYITDRKSIQRFFVIQNKFSFKWKTIAVSLASEIMNTRDILYDHKDRNPLNFKKDNLRIATYMQNAHNRKKVSNSLSKYKGVGWNLKSKKWCARITFDGKRKFLGYFNSEEDAARAYDNEAKILHKEFAVLNFQGTTLALASFIVLCFM